MPGRIINLQRYCFLVVFLNLRHFVENKIFLLLKVTTKKGNSITVVDYFLIDYLPRLAV